MAKLSWDQAGSRYFESGIDRGVLFPESGSGVAWNGLISVSESPSGGESTPYYSDGIKYLNLSGVEEFEGTIEAYTYPEEFEECDGTVSISGVSLHQQDRKSFGLSYRTGLGNDIEGVGYGYKVHLVYNALAAPTEHQYETMDEDTEPLTFSWGFTTRPVEVFKFNIGLINEYKHTAHLTLLSNKMSKFAMDMVESILYGWRYAPRLPLPNELLNLPMSDRPVVVVPNKNTPSEAVTGDLVFTKDTLDVYSLGAAGMNNRPVYVIERKDIKLLPSNAYPGDIAYVASTGDLYLLGG